MIITLENGQHYNFASDLVQLNSMCVHLAGSTVLRRCASGDAFLGALKKCHDLAQDVARELDENNRKAHIAHLQKQIAELEAKAPKPVVEMPFS